MSSGAEAEAAVARGLAFLSRSQQADGGFAAEISTDPAMATGCVPDPAVFPTALIVQSLAGVSGAGQIVARALDFLAGEADGHGLWRHWTRAHPLRDQLPPDLDDTSCISQALVAAGRRPPANQELLLANRDARGLFYTWFIPRLGARRLLWRATRSQLWHVPALVLFFRRTSARPADVDAVVNANALYYLGASAHTRAVTDHLLDVLREHRETACDKWYDNPFAVWYFFSRALQRHAPEAGAVITRRLRDARPASMLDRALAALTQLQWDVAPENDAIAALLAGQLPSGAWPKAALYHGGRRRAASGEYAPLHPDTPRWGSEALTTAFSIEALARWQEARRA